jgi:hypothetical protein
MIACLAWGLGGLALGVIAGYRAAMARKRPRWYRAGGMWP